MSCVVMTQEEYESIQSSLLEMNGTIIGEWGPNDCEHGNCEEDCHVLCACGHKCFDHVGTLCTAKGCTCGLGSVQDQKPHRVRVTFPYLIEFRAHGRYACRIGRELSDGRTVWLTGDEGDTTGESHARGLRTWVKLMYAVRAAKEWKYKAQSRRRRVWNLASLGVSALMGGLFGHYLGGNRRDV